MANSSINNSKVEKSSNGKTIKGREYPHWLSRHIIIEGAIVLALLLGAFFLGRHLFDSTVPAEGDVRSHIFKIEFLQSYLSHFSWPQWNPYWYHGIPEDQFYPPGFYFLGAILSYIFKSGVVAYKILLLIALAMNGLAIYYFSRRFLKFDPHLAFWCLIIYETSTPILINLMYGEGPNLLGWSVTVIFLTVYLSQVMEGKIHSLVNVVLPGFLLGVAVLIHPFPVIFAAISIVVFHAVWLIHNRHDWKTFIRHHLPYIAGVVAIGLVIGMYYWLPAFLTLKYSSPIYSFLQFQWPGGTVYLLALILLAAIMAALVRYKIKGDPVLDTLIVTFIISCALGFGGTRYLPFGLGSLVQEFRFAAIIVPFLAILLILIPLKYRVFRLNTGNLALSLGVGFFLTALIFGITHRDSFITGFKNLTQVNFLTVYRVFSGQFTATFPSFAIVVFPYFAVFLFLALSLRGKPLITGRSKSSFVLAGGACLLLLTSFVPYINTAQSVNIKRLYQYVDNYQKPAYAQIMSSIKDGRLIVPMNSGFLTEGDNPVTFGRQWGVETDNGPYNQGDPKFFKFTVHLEWEDRWFNYAWTRENLMQESASKYIFVRDSYGLPANLEGMLMIVNNPYGKLLELNENVSYANKVTPILIDVKSPRDVTEFFNILLPGGYKLVLVDIHDVRPEMVSRFSYVMTDDATKIPNYPGKTVFLLNDSAISSISEQQRIVTLNVPYLNYTNKIFYHGDIADGYMWLGWNNWPGSKITPEMQVALSKTSNLMASYLNQLDYTQAGYQLNDTRINLTTSPGFTLVKDTYFQYWQSQSADIITTSQGFMLINSNSGNVTLEYSRPLYYKLAIICTIMGLLAATIFLLVMVISRRQIGFPKLTRHP
jgi:hypothetical protein